ncbi:unnamed protein product [Effrenium voratum]|uniref:Uncharacterized protein n=1 Tax=Effrenium voratum TaxID=2562239 RepID=A0AA36NG32_9DINO|nr:unnamed protein product [Effrenium voratum]
MAAPYDEVSLGEDAYAKEDRIPTKFARYFDQLEKREGCEGDCRSPCRAGDEVQFQLGNVLRPASILATSAGDAAEIQFTTGLEGGACPAEAGCSLWRVCAPVDTTRQCVAQNSEDGEAMDSDESPVARRGRRRQVRTAHTRPALAETNPAPKRRLCRAEVSPEPNREAEARAEAPTVAPLRRSRRLKGLPAEEEEMQDEVPRTNRSGHESDDAQDLPSAPEKPRPRPSLLEDESDDAEEVSPASGKLARPASGLLDEESEELARSMAKTSSGKRFL